MQDYSENIEIYLDWAETQGLGLFASHRIEHLQHYAALMVLKGLSKNTIRLRKLPITATCRWAASNWPREFSYIAEGFVLPAVRATSYQPEERPALSIREVTAFLSFLEQVKPEEGCKVILGVALQALAGMRVMEVLRLTWDRFDRDTVLIEGEVKNEASLRRIPLPALVLDLIRDYRDPASPRVVPVYSERNAYGKTVRQLLRDFGRSMPPRELRRTLPTEFKASGLYGFVLERYIGHSEKTITDKHYVALP